MPTRALKPFDPLEKVIVEVLRDKSAFVSHRGASYESISDALIKRDKKLEIRRPTLIAVLDGLRREGVVTGESNNKTIKVSATAEDIISGSHREDYRDVRY